MKPIYRASFNVGDIHGERKIPSLEEVIETAKDWAAKKVRKADLSGFEKGISIDQEKVRLLTITADDKARYFGMKLEHRDSKDKDLLWQAVFTVEQKKDRDPYVEMTLANGWESGFRPYSRIMTRPRLVPELVERFGAYERFPVCNQALKITQKDVELYASLILHPERILPAVFISCDNKTRKPLVNPNKIAMKLSGIAHVLQEDRTLPSFRIGEIIGRTNNCFNGAVRIYWPAADAYNQVWTPDKVHMFKNGLPGLLLKIISENSVSRYPRVTIERIRKVKLRQTRKGLEKKGNDEDAEKILSMYSEEIDVLKDENSHLKEELDSIRDEMRVKDYRIQSLQNALADSKSGTVSQDHVPEFENPGEAKDYFERVYNSEELIFAKKAEKGIKDSPYENPKQFFDALEWLATTYRSIRKGEFNQDLESSCLAKSRMQYRAHENKRTMETYDSDYSVMYKGKKVWLEEHLVQGNSRDPRHTIRIAFHYDAEEDTVLVGYVGQHQRNRNS